MPFHPVNLDAAMRHTWQKPDRIQAPRPVLSCCWNSAQGEGQASSPDAKKPGRAIQTNTLLKKEREKQFVPHSSQEGGHVRLQGPHGDAPGLAGQWTEGAGRRQPGDSTVVSMRRNRSGTVPMT